MNSKRQRNRGQGLIETLAIMLFISVSVVAILKMEHYLSFSTNSTQQQSDATLLGVSELEKLRDYQVLTTTSGYTAYQDIASGTSSATVGNTSYNLTWTVTTYNNPTYKNVSITVAWTDRNGNAQSIVVVGNIVSSDPGVPGSYM